MSATDYQEHFATLPNEGPAWLAPIRRSAMAHFESYGFPTPRNEDWHFTKRMKEAADVMGVELLDHLVLGATGRWASLHRRGAW